MEPLQAREATASSHLSTQNGIRGKKALRLRDVKRLALIKQP